MRDPHFEHLRSQGWTVRPARLKDVPAAVMMFNAAETSQFGCCALHRRALPAGVAGSGFRPGPRYAACLLTRWRARGVRRSVDVG
jgi:hypothetical protein